MPSKFGRFFAVALALGLVWPAAASAQQDPDFLFGSPRGMLGFRTGQLFPSANGDLFEFVTDELTLDRNDFNTPTFGVDAEIMVTPRTSAVIGFDYSKSSTLSEYRDFVDNERLPINQTTSLREASFTGSVKFALTPRGQEISNRAWIPSTFTPYVGAGGGVLGYEFLQFGDFVDFQDFGVFTDTFRSEGWSPTGHVFGGVDVKVWKRFYVSGEGRYVWAKSAPEADFGTFDEIDLGGFKATAGFHVMF